MMDLKQSCLEQCFFFFSWKQMSITSYFRFKKRKGQNRNDSCDLWVVVIGNVNMISLILIDEQRWAVTELSYDSYLAGMPICLLNWINQSANKNGLSQSTKSSFQSVYQHVRDI